jgi:hypothetical protein
MVKILGMLSYDSTSLDIASIRTEVTVLSFSRAYFFRSLCRFLGIRSESFLKSSALSRSFEGIVDGLVRGW